MYYIADGPVVLGRKGGGGFTLVEAMREVYGVGNIRIVREDGTVAVRRAGSAYAPIHAPTGRELVRRKARRIAR